MAGELTPDEREEFSILTPERLVEALRDTRYNSTAHAIAELVDNSIEANAREISLLCAEEYEMVVERSKRRVSEIAVLDNGDGMDPETLAQSLIFGGGTKHDSLRGMGKYGMGLPTASLSQCTKVEIWSWQSGYESAWHSWINVKEIMAGRQTIPMPDQEKIPDRWLRAASTDMFENLPLSHQKSGTLVVWSDLDKMQWKTSSAILRNTAEEVGRIHRHFIASGRCRIQTVSFSATNPDDKQADIVVPNDPTYLMPTTSTPTPWGETPMFREWTRKHYGIEAGGRENTIDVVYSIVKPEALQTDRVSIQPGRQPHGAHARKNIGVSVVREEREIILDKSFMSEGGSSRDPRQRWWGCEVRFGRDADEFFGIDTKKQAVWKFTKAAQELASDDRPIAVVLDEMGVERDPIYELVFEIKNEIGNLMREINKMFGQRTGESTEDRKHSPETKAAGSMSEAIKDAIEAGEEKETQTDEDRRTIPPDEREEAIALELEESGRPPERAKELAMGLVQQEQGFVFDVGQVSGYSIFDVRSSKGILHLTLNMDHPVYDYLNVIEQDIRENADENSPEFKAAVAIRLLLLCWARMEDQAATREERMQIQDIAAKWGRHVDRAVRHASSEDPEMPTG